MEESSLPLTTRTYIHIFTSMADARIKTTIEFYPEDYERLRAYADSQDVGLATCIMRLLEGKKPRIMFQPPSADDVSSHCKERGYTFDPEAFFAFYESKGWKVGNQNMKSWKSACVTWQKRENARGNLPVKPVVKSDREERLQAEAEREIAEIEKRRKTWKLNGAT